MTFPAPEKNFLGWGNPYNLSLCCCGVHRPPVVVKIAWLASGLSNSVPPCLEDPEHVRHLNDQSPLRNYMAMASDGKFTQTPTLKHRQKDMGLGHMRAKWLEARAAARVAGCG
jgi:hypothetical protein